ncbi:MAG: DUF1844 domain-containing protein [Acidobacteriota bacterium]|nr:MAG: DUF1844 domain-containing protein [Acidobacteriota bacterium]
MTSSSFKVADKRKFTSEGDPLRDDEPKKVPDRERGATPEQQSTQATPPKGADDHLDGEDESSVDFAGFLLSLATSSLAHMGELPDPSTGQKEQNLPAAKQMIDILTILREKTKGNLSADEDRLFENLLYELRMKFLSKSKVISL